MSRSSRRKGSAGELEVAAVFRAHGFDARRTPNSGGLSWRGDVVGVPGYLLEVKRCETLSVPAWLRQAYADARGDEVPVVAFRRDGRGTAPDGVWHGIVPLEELARLVALNVALSPNDARATVRSALARPNKDKREQEETDLLMGPFGTS